MAKRYHESKKARKHEHMGMEKYERGSVKHHGNKMHSPHDPNHERPMFNDEERGDKDYVPKGMYNYSPSDMLGDYSSGWEARERMQREQGGMIMDDRRAIANLPQEVMIKPYEKVKSYLPEDLDDSIAGVDGQINYDDVKRNNHYYPKKV